MDRGSLNQRGLSRHRGSVLVETAIIIPLAVFIIAGILDLGYIFQKSTIVYQASRAGARTAGSMTAKLSPENTTAWCGNGAVSLEGNHTCELILEGDFGTLADVDHNSPLKSGMFMACHYLREAGLSPEDWMVAVEGPVDQVEGGTRMRWLRVSVQQSPSAQKCWFCLQQQIAQSLLEESSFFPVQCTL
ncbi:MAG: hypothetical protein RL417_1300 [Pseudomonadota bacterium]|jgi:hypothetical protein